MDPIAREFISPDQRKFSVKLGKTVASSLSGFIAGVIFASLFWIVGIYVAKTFWGF